MTEGLSREWGVGIQRGGIPDHILSDLKKIDSPKMLDAFLMIFIFALTFILTRHKAKKMRKERIMDKLEKFLDRIKEESDSGGYSGSMVSSEDSGVEEGGEEDEDEDEGEKGEGGGGEGEEGEGKGEGGGGNNKHTGEGGKESSKRPPNPLAFCQQILSGQIPGKAFQGEETNKVIEESCKMLQEGITRLLTPSSSDSEKLSRIMEQMLGFEDIGS